MHKFAGSLLVGVLSVVFLNGCLTTQAINRAQGVGGPPQPAYYALVPLAFPLDLVAWPIELIATNGQMGNYQSVPQPSSPPPQQYQQGSGVGYEQNPTGPTGPYYRGPNPQPVNR